MFLFSSDYLETHGHHAKKKKKKNKGKVIPQNIHIFPQKHIVQSETLRVK